MSADTLLSDQTVLSEDGVITRIGARTAIPVPAGTHIIRGHGLVLMPGLADMHVHLDDEADLRRHLEAGVTTVRNMRGEPRHLQWRSEIRTGTRLGPRIITTGPTLTGPVRVNPRHVSVTNAAEISKEVRAQAAYDLIKVHSGFSPGLLARIGAVAESTKRVVVGHLMAGGLDAAFNAHQASIEHVDADVWAEGSIEGSMAKLAQAGTYFCPTLTTFYDGEPDTLGGGDLKVRPSARHRALLVAAKRSGVRLLAGTDAGLPTKLPGAALITELRYMAAAGLPPYEALRTATVNAGRFAEQYVPGMLRIGVVEVGAAADLILLPADPRSNLGVLSSIQGVIAGGRWLDLRRGTPHQVLGDH
jgi:imidazolonepropionase-like amidohydrolase